MSNKIRHYRKKLELSQSKLSNEVGISRVYLSDIETEKSKPTIDISIRIANALGVTVEEIFFTESAKHVGRGA